MRRRKPHSTVQVNLRIKEELRRELEAGAKENHVSFNRELTTRLVDSKPQSLADFLTDFTRRARAIIEHSARKEDIEVTWRHLRTLDAKFARLYTDVEEALTPYLQDPKVRELIRGAQQKQKEGGKP